ncbi:sterol desaturase family protein [Candidatus Njordibacter sp. Uisw_056]|uniref:sterol desaturase family protein n=1 Tax=Candidatus Njordibacter sp. Uisw_056 TaxID=3230973 RepID=UPI003D50DF64
MQWLLEFAQSWFSELTGLVSQGSKRVFLGYLLSAAILAIIWLMWQRKLNFMAAVGWFFRRETWWSRSSRSDYQLMLLNQPLMLLLSPLLLSKLVLATSIFYSLSDWVVRPLWSSDISAFWVSVLFTACLFVVDDASRYYLHRLMHRWPALWAFHRVHHTAESLTPFTVFRTHPVEGVLFGLRSALVQGFLIGIFVFLFYDRVTLLSVLGANVFTAALNFLGSNLRHSPVPISYGKTLERWLISPAQHQIHHSQAREHWNKNFGAFIAVWDRVGNTLEYGSNTQDLTYGLRHQKPQEHQLVTLYWQPFKHCWRCLRRTKIKPNSAMSAISETP